MVGALARRLALACALTAALALGVACGGGSDGAPAATPAAPVDGQLTVRAFEWGFEPAAIILRQGEQVRMELVNGGSILHNWKVDDLPAQVIESSSSGPLEGGEGEAFVGAEAGQEGTLVLVPEAAGTYTYYCTLQGHRELGMEGTLTVE
jgi:uncharacterized cupredoxin-like copper-binding protein